MNKMIRRFQEAYPDFRNSLETLSFIEDLPSGEFRYDAAARELHFGSLSDAARGIGYALSNPDGNAGETALIDTRGLMYDMSRNAVYTLETMKEAIRQMALSGFNRLMLYTEDTYRIEGEEYFGYMRGAYSEEELKEIDAYARDFGIETVGCIQTLGHLEQILIWPEYEAVKDTATVLCIDEDKSYELIEKMVLQMKTVFSSTRIHIGMDEAYNFGKGKFLEKFGFQDSFDIITRHLNRVCEICRKHGLEPMIWSDMFFKTGSATHNYYDLESVIPDYAKARIPEDVTLVYWDYYHTEKDFYDTMLEKHTAVGSNVAVASGIWSWLRFWYDHQKTMSTLKPCLESCVGNGIKDVLLTIWGDDGAYCDYDSIQTGIFLAGNEMYGSSEKGQAERFRTLFHADLNAKMIPSSISGSEMTEFKGRYEASAMLWDDPLLGKYWNFIITQEGGTFADTAVSWYEKLTESLAPLTEDRRMGDNLYIHKLTSILAEKIRLRRDLVEAYGNHDTGSAAVLAERAGALAAEMGELELLFSENWLRRNKPFGLEIMQIRFAGLASRYRELSRRLQRWQKGEISCIDELDEPVPGNPSISHPLYRIVSAGPIMID